jgi:DNA polymerase (family X)
VRTVRGFGPRTEERLLSEIERLREGHGRLHLHRSLLAADALLEHMLASPEVRRADAAGEARRGRETVSSLPLLVAGGSSRAAVERLVSFPQVEAVDSETPSSVTAILTSGLPVRLEWVRRERYGTALVERTGSEGHWRRLEALARERGLSGGLAAVEAAEEAALYARLGLPRSRLSAQGAASSRRAARTGSAC